MSDFFTDTNKGRVKNIDKLLGHLIKSAKSNRADASQIAELFAPLEQSFAELGLSVGSDATPPPVASEQAVRGAPPPASGTATIRTIVDQATSSELTWALAAIANRLDEILEQNGKASGAHRGFSRLPKWDPAALGTANGEDQQ